MEAKKSWLFRRRECLVPTWRGWILLFLICGTLLLLILSRAHSFLAVNDSKPGGEMVVEGWASHLAMELAIAEYRSNHYDRVFVTGGPLELGAPFSKYKTWADLGAAALVRMGLDTNAVLAVPAPAVRQDRTYASAAALRQWFDAHTSMPARINLITEGPHARRSRLLFHRALGKGVTVGVIAVPPRDYNPDHWWRSSAGFRAVVGEALAYVYARIFFEPRTE